MKFVLNRDRVLASTKGHSIRFVKGELTHVPPECYSEAIAIGAVPESELEEPTKDVNARPEDPAKAELAVFKVFEEMKLRNASGEWTAGNMPHVKYIEKYLGWRIEAHERDVLWNKFLGKPQE
jgi:hypothetical protein